jgi:hypothetical protein
MSDSVADDGLRDKGLCKEDSRRVVLAGRWGGLAEVPAVQVVAADVRDGPVAADFAVASPQFLLLVHERPLCRVRMTRT